MKYGIVAAFACGMAAASIAAGSLIVDSNVSVGFGMVSAASYAVGAYFCTNSSAKVSGFVASFFAMTGTIAALVSSIEPCANYTVTGTGVIDSSCSIQQIPEKVVSIAVSVCSFALSAIFSLFASELERRSERRHLMAVVV